MKKRLFILFSLVILCVFSVKISSQGFNRTPKIFDPIISDYNKTELGKGVFVFDPSMNMESIQSLIDTIFLRQGTFRSEFSKDRYALLFMPGTYELDIRVGYYTQVAGLGDSPDDVIIKGSVRSNGMRGGMVLTNFWRSVENLTIVPTVNSTNVWGVSQAAPIRKVHIKGNLQLHDSGWASGGFMADCKVDGTVDSGPQQQWYSRNSEWENWVGGAWNILSMGCTNPPDDNWPDGPFTSIDKVPLSREKPYLVTNGKEFAIQVPGKRENSNGLSWPGTSADQTSEDIDNYYIIRQDKYDAASINKALDKGKDLLFVPGIYYLDRSIKITRPGTRVIGLGMPSLVPTEGNAVIEISDIDGVIVSGLLVDAGKKETRSLFIVGQPGSGKDHQDDPVFLFDIFFRVGGPFAGSTTSCIEVNSNNVFIDHIWLWRADHGNGVGWDTNRCTNGIIVNGDDVTVYGLFNEHNQGYQTLWNGNGGRVYFYQSEMPYDPPTVESWMHDGRGGYASYKVSDDVKTHEAWCVGVYCVFRAAPVIAENAIETPGHLEDMIHNKFTVFLGGFKGSKIKHIINGKGDTADETKRKPTLR